MKKVLFITVGIITAFSIGYYFNYPAISDSTNACRVAVVDMGEIAKHSSKVKQLENEQKSKLNDMQATINRAQLEISKETDKSKIEALSEKYRKEINDKKVAMDEYYNNRLTQINNEIKTAVMSKADKLGYDLVLPKNVTLFGGDDITGQVESDIR